MRLMLLTLLACASMFAQQQHYYVAYKATSLSTAVEKVTIQQPAASARRVIVDSAIVYCSAACTLTFSRGGTAATTTALAPAALSPNSPTVTVTAFHTSNAGAGTVLFLRSLAAGTEAEFDLKGVAMSGPGTTQNFSIATASMSGDVRITIKWREE
jgi:hypothetical protein